MSASHLALALASLAILRAQTAVPAAVADPLGRDNPQSSVIAFLQACRNQNFEQATSYMDLRGLPVSRRAVEGPVLARQLQQLLDKDVAFNAGSLSRKPDGGGIDRVPVARFVNGGKNYVIELERVPLRPSGALVWQFSDSSVAAIPQLDKLITESSFERRLPDQLVNWTLLDTPLWRWLALLLLVLLLTSISSILSRGLLYLARPIVRKASTHLHTAVIEALVGPFRLLVVVAAFRAGMEFIGPSALLRLYLYQLMTLLFLAGVAWVAMRLIDVATDRMRFALSANQGSVSSSILPLGNKIVKIIIFALALAAILSNLGYNTNTLLAGVGVGGLAVALAAQKTLENLLGGVSVIGDRPVLVGDVCKFGERTGKIEDIGLRSTRIRTADRTVVSVPNAQFSSMTLENLSSRDKIWFHPKLSLSRETTPAQVRKLLDSIAGLLSANSKIEADSSSVRFTGVGQYSLDLDVSAYVLTSSDNEFSIVQQDVLLKILDAIEAAGTRLAIPVQANVAYHDAESE